MRKHIIMKRASVLLLSVAMAASVQLPGAAGIPLTVRAQDVSGEASYPIAPDAEDVTALWTEERTSDDWIKVTNEGGAVLGYSRGSGVRIIQVDGFAFKDLNRNEMLDEYEDWRLDAEVRSTALAEMLSAEEIMPLLTHGGWSSFSAVIEGKDLTYVENGGRAGTSRSAAANGNTATAADWTNALQALCEKTGGYGIPATISVDPVTISGTIQQTAIAATFDTELTREIGERNAKEYRAVGITMLLGPQIDLTTTPVWKRASGTYSEDPALNRDLAIAYIDGLQSTFDEEGNDLGWGNDSVVAVVKHFVGTGAAQGGRDDHNAEGKFTVFPGNDFEAHLIPFFDGAFQLEGKTEQAGGVMPNYGITYSEDGSLGKLVGGAYSTYKIDMLRTNGYDGFLLTDWGVTGDSYYNISHMTIPERFAELFMVGNDQVGGSSDIEGALAGYEVMVDYLGEKDALKTVRNCARRFFRMQMQLGLFENPYVSKQEAVMTAYTEDSNAFGRSTQEKSIIMLKNSEDLIHAYDESAEKLTVYIPYVCQSIGSKRLGYTFVARPSIDLELAGQYFNVVTDTLGDPTGEADRNGNPMYQLSDIIRADSEEIASCDLVILSMLAPYVESVHDAESDIWYPSSIQYEAYAADSDAVKQQSIAADMEVKEVDTQFYGTTTEEVKGNWSYYGNTAALPKSYNDYETLKYVKDVISDDCKVLVMMRTMQPLVWSEVEPLADAILMYFNGYEGAVYDPAWFQDEALMNIITGQVEPSALLPYQQPASMEAVEAQNEDVPRDVECYVDANGNVYDFGFGLNWSGVIDDERVDTYCVPALTEVASFELQ